MKPLPRFSVALAVAMFALTANAQTQCVMCGSSQDRWEVKTGCDDAAANLRINLSKAIDTTVAEMRKLEAPDHLQNDATRHQGVEDQVFVVEATLTTFFTEADHDRHLVLRDGGVTMIAESTDPDCVSAHAPLRDFIVSARKSIDDHFNGHKSQTVVNERVRVWGIGFFDVPHGKPRGVAPNRIELHPILKIEFLP
ncbi:MAG TPA: hypothetical protein VKU62_01260 [Thermoanaerobaculia bacterium]|nr:hypothetical protein [Thermoanaerobaculia bacterium]